MQFVTASETAVFISAISSIVGSSEDTNAATVTLANDSLLDLLEISKVISLSYFIIFSFLS